MTTSGTYTFGDSEQVDILTEAFERIGRNPKTGVEVPITPRRVMVFKPSNLLKARINGAPADE